MIKHIQTIRRQQPTNLCIFTDKLHHKCLIGSFQEISQEQPGIFDFHQIFDIEIFLFLVKHCILSRNKFLFDTVFQ